MRIVTWTVRLIVFVALLAFAAKNADPVTLKFFFDWSAEMPLVVLAFCFFAAGAVLGLVAAFTTVLRQRREIVRLRRLVRDGRSSAPAPAEGAGGRPVLPDVIDA